MKILFIGYGSIAIKHKISLEKKFKKINFYALRHKIDYIGKHYLVIQS